VTAEAPLAGVEGLGAQSLVELALRRLRAEILDGELAPGERLVEEQLTRRFGISRAPLREALRLLGQQGLVEHLPRRGVRVTELSAKDINELFSLRDVLEEFAVRTALAGGTPDPGRLAALQRATERIERASAENRPVERAEAHREYHLALVALAGHHHLLRMYEPVILQLQLYMATNLRREAEQRSAVEGAKRHRRLYDAVASGNADAVMSALHTHGAQAFLAPELGAHVPH
jgi:DNA-binding GntR family transcriptional regulator